MATSGRGCSSCHGCCQTRSEEEGTFMTTMDPHHLSFSPPLPTEPLCSQQSWKTPSSLTSINTTASSTATAQKLISDVDNPRPASPTSSAASSCANLEICSCASTSLRCCPILTVSSYCASPGLEKVNKMPCQHPPRQRPGTDHMTANDCIHISSTHGSSTCCADFHILQEDMLNTPGVDSCSKNDDVERGPASYERVILSVGGLKCGCCETGLSKALRHVPAIQNHQVNVVLARIEFDLDSSRCSVSQVIARLHKATGYTFEKYDQPEGQVLELLVDDASEIHRAGRPFGVTQLESEGKQYWRPAMLWSGRNSAIPPEPLFVRRSPDEADGTMEKRVGPTLYRQTVRVDYNAKQIGARDVFEYYQQLAPSQNVQLAPASAHPSLAIGARQTKRACILFAITSLFTIPVVVFAYAPIDHSNIIYAHISLALATLVQIIAINEFVPGAFQSLVHSGLFEMDFLVALSTSIAYVYSVVAYVFQVKQKPLETGCFFETSTMLVALILLGRAVNEYARFRAAKSVSVRSLQTQEALLVVPGGSTAPGGDTRVIDARLLQYGDRFKVVPHTRIVTDGEVVYGGSEVDESMITGETIPVAKALGNTVHAGTTNGGGQLVVALTKLPHENSISRIATMVENAELSKPKVQALADRIAGWFVPAMATIGLLVFLTWMLFDRFHNRRAWSNAVIRALTHMIATLIVSCPCAIGLAVPMVVLIASGTSARFGIIFREPQKLEIARNTTDVVFDKTGTLTTGSLTVVEGKFYGAYPESIKGVVLGLLEGDKHPVAVAVCKWVKAHPDDTAPILPMKMTDIQSEPGSGVAGVCEASKLKVRAGNPDWLGVTILESQHTHLCVTIDGFHAATFRLQDRERPGAKKVVELLSERGISVHMISGDGEGAVNEIAHTLNIPKVRTRWRLKPVDKQKYIHELQKADKVVMFCGDGTNDSVALKQADVGVHVNGGSDVAKGASDVVLMTTRLHDILILLDISIAAYKRIILNFGWSALYNLLAILMAAGAFVKFRIEPQWAGLGELVSVLPIIVIAFSLKWRDYGRRYRGLE